MNSFIQAYISLPQSMQAQSQINLYLVDRVCWEMHIFHLSLENGNISHCHIYLGKGMQWKSCRYQ